MDLALMTEEEAEAEEFRLQPEVHGERLLSRRILDFDEEQPVRKTFKPAIDEREIQARALRFGRQHPRFLSRTHKAGQLRLLAARLLITGSPTADQICRRMKVSKRQVQRALRGSSDFIVVCRERSHGQPGNTKLLAPSVSFPPTL